MYRCCVISEERDELYLLHRFRKLLILTSTITFYRINDIYVDNKTLQ